MQARHNLRSLALLRSSGSTARALNLTLVSERFGNTPEWQERPLFRAPALNRCMLIKHVVRQSEKYYFDNAPVTTTKLVFPFSAEELQLGGRSILLGERTFRKALKDVSGALDAASAEADLALLELLDSLPSFDPFLMRERLRQSGYEPARCYFDVSEGDVARMRAFVAGEIAQLVELAFVSGGSSSRELASRLADKLMTDETAKALDPLRTALQLSEEDYREGVFSWKGFIYYKWLSASLREAASKLITQIASLRVNGADAMARQQLHDIKRRIIEAMQSAIARIDAALLDYGSAFAALADGEPQQFRSFLLRAPSLFIPIGQAIGVLQHIETFWKFRFPGDGLQIIHTDEAYEVLGDFDAALATLGSQPKTAEYI